MRDETQKSCQSKFKQVVGAVLLLICTTSILVSQEKEIDKKSSNAFVIHIKENAQVMVGEEILTLQELQKKLEDLTKKDTNLSVTIHGVGEESYKDVFKVLDACRKAKVKNISLSSRSKQKENKKNKKTITIIVQGSNKVMIGKQSFTLRKLQEKLESLIKKYADSSVIIQAKQQQPYKDVIMVMGVCHKANVNHISLAVMSKEKKEVKPTELTIDLRANGDIIFDKKVVALQELEKKLVTSAKKSAIHKVLIFADRESRIASLKSVLRVCTKTGYEVSIGIK